ncbi:MAG: potassium-transporting ATPase subunit KdpC [Angustibacter sp.]
MSSPTFRTVGAAVRMLVCLTVLLGVGYPVAVWGIGRLALPHQANGSRIERGGVVVGSSLLGQAFTDSRHFHGRPSASDYAGGVSGGTNLYASAGEQRAALAQRRAQYAATNQGAAAPPDALTASASGLDPDISPENALAQVPRVAQANGLDRGLVEDLVRRHTEGRVLGFLGQPRVNVLELNLALDAAADR